MKKVITASCMTPTQPRGLVVGTTKKITENLATHLRRYIKLRPVRTLSHTRAALPLSTQENSAMVEGAAKELPY